MEYQLTTGGVLIMLVSISTVLCLVGYCLVKVMNLPPVDGIEHVKGPLEIDTQDTEDPD